MWIGVRKGLISPLWLWASPVNLCLGLFACIILRQFFNAWNCSRDILEKKKQCCTAKKKTYFEILDKKIISVDQNLMFVKNNSLRKKKQLPFLSSKLCKILQAPNRSPFIWALMPLSRSNIGRGVCCQSCPEKLNIMCCNFYKTSRIIFFSTLKEFSFAYCIYMCHS